MESKQKKKRTNVERAAIVSYWSKIINDEEININWDDDPENMCWSCAYAPTNSDESLQKCHIIPKALGGSDEPSNMVILCVQCHRENPNVNNTNGVELYWHWLKSRTRSRILPNGVVKGLGGFWCERMLKEYENMYGINPFTDILILCGEIGEEPTFLKNLVPYGLGKYCGDGQRFSPTSVATLLRQFIIDKRLEYQQSLPITGNIVHFEGSGPSIEII